MVSKNYKLGKLETSFFQNYSISNTNVPYLSSNPESYSSSTYKSSYAFIDYSGNRTYSRDLDRLTRSLYDKGLYLRPSKNQPEELYLKKCRKCERLAERNRDLCSICALIDYDKNKIDLYLSLKSKEMKYYLKNVKRV